MKNCKKLRQKSLNYHEKPIPGKLGTKILKPIETKYNLSLAYTPGVAEPVRKIAENSMNAYRYTNKGNLVAVISNGSAILGLGNLGAIASKPVMEGKGVLFKLLADIDVYDIEIDSKSIASFIQTVYEISPTFGGINLEDIKAPDCFQIEYELKKILDIPVFHDDQHGTAIVIAAALLNALELIDKFLNKIKIVCLGAGAAGLATMNLLVKMGVDKNQITVLDSKGVIHSSRRRLNIYKYAFAKHTNLRTLDDAIKKADVFIGVSGPNLLKPEHLKSMSENPIVFALSNPDPEINPELAKSVRKDIILATGRSDYPNQVNNVLCFPYIFRGALDAKIKKITYSMCFAAIESIRNIAKLPIPKTMIHLYPDINNINFGREYLLPNPMDPRLKKKVSTAVFQAALASNIIRK